MSLGALTGPKPGERSRIVKHAIRAGWKQTHRFAGATTIEHPDGTIVTFLTEERDRVYAPIVRQGENHGGLSIWVDEITKVIDGARCVCPTEGENGVDVRPADECKLSHRRERDDHECL